MIFRVKSCFMTSGPIAGQGLGWLIVGALISGLTGIAGVQAADAPPTLAVKSSSVELPVASVLPEGTVVDAQAGWQLVEPGTDTAIPAQIGAAPDEGGEVAEGRQRVLAVIPAGGEDEAWREFQLVPAEDPPAAVFDFEDITDASVKAREGDQPVFVYNHGVITREDLPESERRRSRSCYIHPVYGMSGEVLTDDFPRDHYHHHGVFWTWPFVRVNDQRYDTWHDGPLRQVFGRWLVREVGPVAAVLAVENGWIVDGDRLMIERVWMRAYRAGADDRALDVELFFTPEAEITLRGAAGKSYGGLTVRFAPGSRAETRITVPSGPTSGDLPDTPLKWADFTSRFGDLEHRSGAAIFVPPHHPDYPPAWLTRHYGPLCIGYPGVNARTFEPGTPFAIDYRLWIHREEGDFEELKEVYQGYVRATEAQWK